VQTVFIILMENHDWSQITANDAPYIRNTLLPMGAHANSYTGPFNGALHPSEPNYVWLEAGDNFGILNDNAPASNHQSTTQHLVTLLKNANISWKTYQEDISGSVCPTMSTGNYAPKHNPMIFFDDSDGYNSSTGQFNSTDSYCVGHMRPMSE